MNSPDQPETTTESFEGVHDVPLPKSLAAFFAITARFHAQPATSFVPVAVLSATGCGLLVTAIRKLHTSKGVGLLEAALGGFFMALLQFTVALTYPGVFDSISFGQTLRNDFLITWTLIAVFSIIFSLAGATLGHLSFAPLRPLPASSSSTASIEEKDTETPTVAAYIFSAAYDFTLSFNQFVPGPYPTLRILSALLPWQIPIPIDLNNGIENIIIFSLLWRIPLFLGNPSLVDLQALEPYIFNGAAFALLLLTMYQQNARRVNQFSYPGWVAYLSMEAALGLILVLPANLWILRGLEGLIQFHDIVIPIRTISILNPLTFSLNLITGPLVCVGLGIVLRIFLSKRTV